MLARRRTLTLVAFLVGVIFLYTGFPFRQWGVTVSGVLTPSEPITPKPPKTKSPHRKPSEQAVSVPDAAASPALSSQSSSSDDSSAPHSAPPRTKDVSPQLVEFWGSFSKIVFNTRPRCPEPKRTDKKPTEVGFDVPLDKLVRPNFLEMPRSDVEIMKEAHTHFLKEMNNNPPVLPYSPGTRGLVTTAGGAYMPILIVSLRMLRRTGSQLPVEVFLSSPDEYEPLICEAVLKELNAKCVILSDILESVPEPLEIKTYQFKAFAMLFSSFEEILFIDADNIVVNIPEDLFDSEPFISKHMVTWPDFWANTASELFFEIVSQPVPSMSVRQSTESGQILISKKTHSSTLLLSAYYNYWGPSHYYRLLSQHAPGEGDKETFLAAATAVNASFYAVSERVSAIGYRYQDKFHGTAMVQYNPTDDYNLTQQGLYRVIDRSVADPPRRAFVHANYPKTNAANLLDHAATVHPDGVRHRMWGPKEETERAFGVDLERFVWKEMTFTGCGLERDFAAWKEKTGICDKVQDHWQKVFEKDDQLAQAQQPQQPE
ncbi:MAG: hypothetical protein M1825_006052 [Sarcosagium campestre]|nr:MAG: hypothetical protein M1825_006052 [Sarcosagium campestre]